VAEEKNRLQKKNKLSWKMLLMSNKYRKTKPMLGQQKIKFVTTSPKKSERRQKKRRLSSRRLHLWNRHHQKNPNPNLKMGQKLETKFVTSLLREKRKRRRRKK